MGKKRPKYILELIEMANSHLKMRELSDTSPLFWFMQSYLIKKKMYEGYNYYKISIDDDGNKHTILTTESEAEFVQFY